MARRPSAVLVWSIGFVLTVGACAMMKKVTGGGNPSVTLTATQELNVRSDGRALGSLHVRAYLLTDAANFRSLSYDDLWSQRKLDKDAAVLDVQEDVVTPDSKKKLELKQKKDKEAKFIAVLAGYAEPESDGAWRQVVALEGGHNNVEIALGPKGMRPAALK